MLESYFPFPDAADIVRDPVRWHPAGRGEAIRACLHRPVAVLSRNNGRTVAGWFNPGGRFFRSDGPFLYEELRYYVYTGAERSRPKGLRIPPPSGDTEWEEILGEDGEPISLGSPTSRIPTTPKTFKIPDPPKPALSGLPAIPDLPNPSGPGIPQMPQLPGLPEPPGLAALSGLPAMPEMPKIPGLPGMPEIPEIPAIPGLDIPGAPNLPIPGIPGVPELSGLVQVNLDLAPTESDVLYPIEYRLLDEAGKPIPPTHYRLTFPNGDVKTGVSDADGFIRYPDNRHKGQATLVLLEGGRHPIEIKLVDHDEQPLPNTAYRLRLPDGTVKEGVSDSEGYIRHPENDQEGEAHLILPDYT